MKFIGHRPLAALAAISLALFIQTSLPGRALSQGPDDEDPFDDEDATIEELLGDQSEYGLTPDGESLEADATDEELDAEGGDEDVDEDEAEVDEDEEALTPDDLLDEIDLGREEDVDEARWTVKINMAVRANYVFSNSPDSFVIKYTLEVEGAANAETAVIRGNATIGAEVEGFLARWPTGECSLSVSIPKIPFDLTFRKSGEEKGSVSLTFRRPIMENWKSRCSFTDAPGARFETSGPPEKWLSRAIEKARPPLRLIVTDITDEETTTSFVIAKEVIDDPPLGSVEIEGTGVVTITPGG